MASARRLHAFALCQRVSKRLPRFYRYRLALLAQPLTTECTNCVIRCPPFRIQNFASLIGLRKREEESFMRKIAYIGLGVFLLASFAAAQSGNIFVGYSLENTNWAGLNSSLSRPNLNGWEASLEGKVFPHLGIVTDFASHYGSQSFTEFPPSGPVKVNVTGHEWEVLFGPRLSIPVGNFTPFAEAMFGVAHVHNG